MSNRTPRIAVCAAALLAAIAAGCSANAKDASTTARSAGAPACDIRVSNQGGALAIGGVVTGPASGTYSFRVRGGGTDIEQSGPFAAGTGPTNVGDVTLSRGRYDVTLTVSAGGRKASCSKRIG